MLKDGDRGVIIQRDKKTYAVAPHVPCGVITPETLRKLADVAEKYKVAALKITSAARIALVGIEEADVDGIWEDLGMEPGGATGLCVRSIKACTGTTFCNNSPDLFLRDFQIGNVGIGRLIDLTAQQYPPVALDGVF